MSGIVGLVLYTALRVAVSLSTSPSASTLERSCVGNDVVIGCNDDGKEVGIKEDIKGGRRDTDPSLRRDFVVPRITPVVMMTMTMTTPNVAANAPLLTNYVTGSRNFPP